MGRKCCVTGCNGNYDKQNVVSTFRRDPGVKKSWLKATPRETRLLQKKLLCVEDIGNHDIHLLCFGKPRSRDPPSELSCVKSSLVPCPPAYIRTAYV